MSDATNHEARIRELERQRKLDQREIEQLKDMLARAIVILGQSRQNAENLS